MNSKAHDLIYQYAHKAPFISLHLTLKQGELISTSLSLSPTGFSCFANEPPPPSLLNWIDLYLQGSSPPLTLPLRFLPTPPFIQQVLRFLSTIPFGSVMSYGEVAQATHNPKACRAVGQACGRNPYPLFIPCHRVIRSGGRIGGFALDHEIKQELLLFETKRNYFN